MSKQDEAIGYIVNATGISEALTISKQNYGSVCSHLLPIKSLNYNVKHINYIISVNQADRLQ
jgi:hypothetical protein